MKIALVGSIKFYPKIKQIVRQLKNNGHEIVFYPQPFFGEISSRFEFSNARSELFLKEIFLLSWYNK